MRILGIETSCDETAVSVVEVDAKRLIVRTSVVNSQINIHAVYGGVVPEVAARNHIINIIPLLDLALREAQITLADIDAIAVTQGPGLVGALMVGLETAKTLAWSRGCTFIPVNHLSGHLWSWLLPAVGTETTYKVTFPHLSLIVSGGHTEIVLTKRNGQNEIIGQTLDDAVGEAFDKVAKILGLGYPGGPALARLAVHGDRGAFKLPRPLEKDGSFNFSFSGLKTAVLYQDRKVKNRDSKYLADMAASFETAAVDVLIGKLVTALSKYNIREVSVVGGVSANDYLRTKLRQSVPTDVNLHLPRKEYTGDNAAMIALAGYFANLEQRERKDYLSLSAIPSLELENN